MSSRRRGRRHPGGPTTGAGIAAPNGMLPAEEPQVGDFEPDRDESLAPDSGHALAPAAWDGAGRPEKRGGQPRRSGKQQRPRPQAQPPAPRPIAVETEPALDSDAEACKPKGSCTLAQMRRFIKSRPYVPVHELRRRFEIEGIEDEVSPMITDRGTYYVGLPEREAGFLAELLKSGDVGCELLLDPSSPAVVGVYAMRPVARQ